MVAYNFQPQFIAPIGARTKRQTLRNPRPRHAQVGETLQLYTGMRTRACQLIGTATCIAVLPIRIDFKHRSVDLTTTPPLVDDDELTTFAVFDGFASWPDLVAFWREQHGELDAWEGVRIMWGETFVAAGASEERRS